MVPSPKRELLLYQKIVHAIVMHQKAIKSVSLHFYYNAFCRFAQYFIFQVTLSPLKLTDSENIVTTYLILN